MEKIIKNMFNKKTYINGVEATYKDMLWLFANLKSKKDCLKGVRVYSNKMFIYTI